jgi:signal transduction histidine kinase
VTAARPRLHKELQRLADSVLEAADLQALTAILTRDLKAATGSSEATLLLWDRKLETFEGISPDGSRRERLDPRVPHASPQARFLLADGQLIDTAREGDGTLVPLLARSGLIGMLVLGPRKRRRAPPYNPAEVRQLSALAKRSALALENHLYQRELIASERLAALGTMAGMLAHDFRGPMTVIRGYAELLQDQGASPVDVAAHARLITEMIDRLERMTTETLDFAKGGGRLVKRTVGLRKFLTILAEDLESELPGLKVLADLSLSESDQGCLDVDKLRRALGNIAANARDAMGGRGRIHLAAEIQQLPNPDGTPGTQPRLVLLLRDEGPGVDPAIRDRLFDPFVTQGKKGGTGLGLAVARRFVEDHAGTVELLPERPGARFRITLPLGVSKAAEA